MSPIFYNILYPIFDIWYLSGFTYEPNEFMKNKIFFYNFVWKVKSNQTISHVYYILPTFIITIIIITLLMIFFTGLQRDEHAEVVGHGQGSLLCFARGQGRLFIIVLIIVIIMIITMIIKIILRLQFTVMPVLGGLGCSWPATLSTTSGNSFFRRSIKWTLNMWTTHFAKQTLHFLFSGFEATMQSVTCDWNVQTW